MQIIKSFTVSCDAETLLKNGGWSDLDYWSLYDDENAVVEYDFKADDFGVWEKGYSHTEFEGDYMLTPDPEVQIPVVYATMFKLFDMDIYMTVAESTGKLTPDEILEWFPELQEVDHGNKRE
ncbi:MAG: hypothetical protein IJI14_06790 [Anaerolineaceae bacterium]|nr:hypothetical protein [Anaerolineaceae bacterium]